MNSIHQKQSEIYALAAERSTLKQGMADLRSYLLSPKFNHGNETLDGYVAIADVLNWMRETESAAVIASEDSAANFKKQLEIDKQLRLDRIAAFFNHKEGQ